MVLPLNVTTLLRIFLMCVFGVIAITGCSSSSGADETGSDFVELELKLTKDVKLQAREMLRFLTTDETDFTTIASFSPSECPFNAGEFLMGMSLVKSMVDTGGDWDVEITSIEFLSDQTALVETVMLKDGQPFSWNDKQTRGSKELWVLQGEKWRATTGCDTYEAQMNLINLRDAKIVLIGERFPIGSIHVTVEDFWLTKTPPRSTDPSPKGVYLVVKYRFENTGTQPVSPWGNLSLKLYDESGRTWDGAAMSILDVGPGLSGTFEADWDVPSNLSSFLLELKPGHSSSADGEQSTIVRLADEKTALKEATTASTPDPTSSPSTTPKASTPTTTATVTPSPSATPTPTSNPPTAATPTATVTQTPTDTPTATPTKATPGVWSSNKQLILERGWGCRNSDYGNYIYTEGQVTNNTSRSLKYLKTYVSMMAGDTFVTSDSTYVDFTTLLPGQSSAFKIITDGNPAITSCKISFQDEDGYVSYEKRPEPTPVPTPTPTPTPEPTPSPTPTPEPTPTPIDISISKLELVNVCHAHNLFVTPSAGLESEGRPECPEPTKRVWWFLLNYGEKFYFNRDLEYVSATGKILPEDSWSNYEFQTCRVVISLATQEECSTGRSQVITGLEEFRTVIYKESGGFYVRIRLRDYTPEDWNTRGFMTWSSWFPIELSKLTSARTVRPDLICLLQGDCAYYSDDTIPKLKLSQAPDFFYWNAVGRGSVECVLNPSNPCKTTYWITTQALFDDTLTACQPKTDAEKIFGDVYLSNCQNVFPSGLGVGQHNVRFRMVTDKSGTGPWSEPIYFELVW